jgi:hypothetical protein
VQILFNCLYQVQSDMSFLHYSSIGEELIKGNWGFKDEKNISLREGISQASTELMACCVLIRMGQVLESINKKLLRIDQNLQVIALIPKQEQLENLFASADKGPEAVFTALEQRLQSIPYGAKAARRIMKRISSILKRDPKNEHALNLLFSRMCDWTNEQLLSMKDIGQKTISGLRQEIEEGLVK